MGNEKGTSIFYPVIGNNHGMRPGGITIKYAFRYVVHDLAGT